MQNLTFDNPVLALITKFTKRLISARHARFSFSGLVNENEILVTRYRKFTKGIRLNMNLPRYGRNLQWKDSKTSGLKRPKECT